jgi:hypothetical protein
MLDGITFQRYAATTNFFIPAAHLLWARVCSIGLLAGKYGQGHGAIARGGCSAGIC